MMQLPLLKKSSIDIHFFIWDIDNFDFQDKDRYSGISVDKECFLGIFFMLAIVVELFMKKNRKDLDPIIERIQEGLLASPLKTILRFRLNHETMECIERAIKECNLKPHEENLLRKWSQREIDLIK